MEPANNVHQRDWSKWRYVQVAGIDRYVIIRKSCRDLLMVTVIAGSTVYVMCIYSVLSLV